MKKTVHHRVLGFFGPDEQDKNTDLIRTDLAQQNHEVVWCGSAQELSTEIRAGAGMLLLNQKVLQLASVRHIVGALKEQPAWSHLPMLVLLPEGGLAFPLDRTLETLEQLGHLTLLEAPVRPAALVTTIRSVLAYREKQYEMRDLMAELETSQREAVEANRAKSDFLANMSHEIRTPLGAILGFSELLIDAGVNEREKHVYMTAVKRNGQLLSALIDDILDLARVESGRIEIASIEFSLGELLSEVISSMEPVASKKSLPLVVHRPSGQPDHITADPIRLKQILVNIVGNAIKFTSHGSVTLRVDFGAPATGNEAQLKIEVEDTGIGISAQQEAMLFKPFTQADTSTTRRFGGTGLGLVLSQKLTRAMGGDLRLNWSIPGGGSNFGFHLPVLVAQGSRGKEEGKVAGVPGLLPLAGAKILVVDDSLDNQMLISRILKLLGAEVDLANDGVEAVEKAMAHPFEVVLMDLQMPRLGGVEATKLLRSKGYAGPIVALTAHALQEDRQRCLSVGCTDYLTKPIQRSHLVEVLERLSREASALARTH